MKENLLSHICFPADLRLLSQEQLPQVVHELRRFIIDIVSQKGGHLGASLGVVELTVALHYVFNTPDDLLVWDVGHQAYGHKILTGRRDIFHKNREKDGISGFPKRTESKYDTFGVGHSSTSISAALGMALASQLMGDFEKHHIAVIGDASIASGMAFEGLNHAGVTNANLLIVLNDNAMGIDPSVGALKNYLTAVKNGKSTGNNIIQSLNIDYSGAIDGHNLPLLIAKLQELKQQKGVKFLHITTTKGKGLQLAEENQIKYHAPGKFEAETGKIKNIDETDLPPKFQDVFGHTLVELAAQNTKIVGITPAMPTGSSMKFLMEAFPERAFDVGIAEQHAVTLSAGMATQGMIVYCNIYSTFLQRAYDQIIHDTALQNLPIIFCLDRAGFVGEDGATHHGVYDIAYLNCVPNMQIAAPLNEIELRNLLYTVQAGALNNPIAIRYPRGRGEIKNWQKPFEKLLFGKAVQLKNGSKIAVLSTGTIGNNVAKALSRISENEQFSHYHFLFAKPLDAEVLVMIAKKYQMIITVEEGAIIGGFGSSVAHFLAENNFSIPVKKRGVPDIFVEQATVQEQQEQCGIGLESLMLFFQTCI